MIRGFVSTSSVAVYILVLTVSTGVHHTSAECWDTGCQLDSWLVKGCEQYDGMTEIKRKPCGHGGKRAGHVYSCCYQRNSIDSSQRLCWATECILDSVGSDGRDATASDGSGGCSSPSHYRNTIEVERSPCDGGHVYFCCNSTNDPSDAVQLNKIGDLTYYSLGLTACGQVYADDDMVAAIAFDHFTTPNPNLDPVCGKRVKIIDPTTLKSIVVTVRDKCEACNTNDIDVSPSAFEKLKPKIVGRIKVVWDFI
ncbi:DPBB 1 domain-containing protein [Aphis craccivora]|uniref:DPBB 1 domain-containing protein n=1 Tax=Aphis craccivora TaxID=307492 RepID=A0A6G0WPG4_APHCR|nr:DPBB 1 domain-containing protein [Aphis craccivora]